MGTKKRDHKKALANRQNRIRMGLGAQRFSQQSTRLEKQISLKTQSLNIAIGTLNLNAIDLSSAYNQMVKELFDFINTNYSDTNPPGFPQPEQKHKELMELVTYRFCNYLSSYKSVLEIVNSIRNTTGSIRQEIQDFINFINGSEIYRFSKFSDNDSGLLVALRNSFDHNIISPITFQISSKMLFSDYIVMAKHEDDTLSGEALINTAKEKQEKYPNAAIYRYDGKKWKHMMKIFAYLNYKVLSNGNLIRKTIEDADETHDVIQIVLENHKRLLPYLGRINSIN